jgi:hypothetical protein
MVRSTRNQAAIRRHDVQVRATILVDGRVAGPWRSERKRNRAVFVIEKGDALPAFLEADALEREVRWAT